CCVKFADHALQPAEPCARVASNAKLGARIAAFTFAPDIASSTQLDPARLALVGAGVAQAPSKHKAARRAMRIGTLLQRPHSTPASRQNHGARVQEWLRKRLSLAARTPAS